MTIRQSATIERNARHRKSSDTAWPLRGADGLTFAERHAAKQKRVNFNLHQIETYNEGKK